jgi:Fe-S-cluster containining protein
LTSKEIKISKGLENGIGFSCKMCGVCCRGFNEGEVYIFKDDIIRLSKYLGLKGKKGLAEFAKRYLKVIKNTFYYKEPGADRGKNYKFDTLGFKFTGKDEHCTFLKDNKCSIHEARPFQCRCFPFWQMMVESKKNLVNYSKKCAGLKESLENKGTFYSPEKMIEWARREYEIEKEYFLEMKNYDFDILKLYPFLPKDFINTNQNSDENKREE